MRLTRVLLSPYMTEKASMAADKNTQIVFKVRPDSNKIEIKQAVEKMFKVTVVGVNVCNFKAKTRRFGRVLGETKAWKKAYVKLKEGDNIDFVDAEK